MKLTNFDKHMMAAAYAEAGEADAARLLMATPVAKSANTVMNALDKIMAAVTFAEANEPDKAVAFMTNSAGKQQETVTPSATAGVNVTQVKQKPMEKAAMAATFAEADEHATARQILGAGHQGKTILVIGNDAPFSAILIDYAIDMAKRMQCDILAVNTTDAPLRLPREAREEACEKFIANSTEYGAAFAKIAEGHGLGMQHFAELGSQEKIIEQLHASQPNILYCLTEPEDKGGKESGRVSVPVFRLAHSHF